jgi:hypothetical protein
MELLAEAAVRAVVLALAVAFVLKILGIRAPRLVHRAWTAVAAIMLLLPVFLAWAPRVAMPVLPQNGVVVLAPGSHGTIGQRDVATTAVAAVTPDTPRRITLRTAATAGYFAGVAVLLFRLGIGLHRAGAIRRRATWRHGRLSHPHCVTPMTVGVLAPSVILPGDWVDWDPEDLAAVLAHEHEHVRRRDPLVTVISLVNRAVFWFHPLSWWLHREIARRAEQACDAAVITRGHDVDRYSSCLLRFARRVTATRGRIAPVATAMPGSGLPQRLHLLAVSPSKVPSAARVACAALVGGVVAVACCLATPEAARRTATAQRTTNTAQRTGDVKWLVHTTPHFEVFHEGLTPQQIAGAERDAEAAYRRLSQALRYDMPRSVPLILVRRDNEAPVLVEEAQVLIARSGAPRRQVVILPIESIDRGTNLIVHELTHQFAFEIVPKTSASAPLLIEGLAEHMRGRWQPGDLRDVRAVAATGAVPPVREPDINSRPWGHALFDFVRAEHGEEGVRRLLFALRSRGTVAQAVPMAFDTTNDNFDQAFQAYVIATFGQRRSRDQF